MGFFSGIKKALKKVTKVAIKTAPLWSSFVPGGSIATGIISRVADARSKLRASQPGVASLVSGLARSRAPTIGGGHFGHALPLAARRSMVGEGAHAAQGVGMAGIKGPVPMKRYGQMITASSLRRAARVRGRSRPRHTARRTRRATRRYSPRRMYGRRITRRRPYRRAA